MELLQLKYFKRVAEAEKISEAAKSLYISPPALSAAIARLENELGVKLFDHGNNYIRLNAQGAIFLRHVNDVFRSLEMAQTEIANSLDPRTNNLQIAVTTSVLWNRFLIAFSDEYPHISVSSTTIKIEQINIPELFSKYTFLIADQEDLGESWVESVCLFEDEPMLMVGGNHPFANREYVQLEELNDQRLVLPMSGQSMNRRLKKLLLAHDVQFTNFYECSDTTCREIVKKKNFCGFTTKYSYLNRKADTELCYLPIFGHQCKWKQLLCWSSKHKFTPSELLFKHSILNFFQSHQAGNNII